MSILLNGGSHPDWLTLARQALHYQGLVVLQDVLDAPALQQTRDALLAAQKAYYAEIGPDKEQVARSQGDVDIRVPMKYHPQFFTLMEHPVLLQLVDTCLGGDAVLRFANGSVHAAQSGQGKSVPNRQEFFHMNFKQVLQGYPAALDVVFIVDAGGDRPQFEWVPGSHQRMRKPTAAYLEWAASPIHLPAGSLVVMDPTLWHRDGSNENAGSWMSVHYEFVQPFLKPHMDYMRLLGMPTLAGLPARTRRLLGEQAQVPASLEEFYLPAEQRVYQAAWGIGMDEEWT